MASLLDWVRQALEPRYKVEAVLARGGMGAVFRAHDPRLQRPVAIKVLLPEIATAETSERFLREARVLAQIQHPHVVPVHEVDEADGLFYYVMDFLEGPTLSRLLESGPLTPTDALKLGRDMLDALEAVHALGFIHRDVKPGNLFMARGRAVLTDFGIVTSSGPETDRLTRANDLLGTRAYMAPELLAGEKATPQSDLYAAGMVLYEAYTGRHWPAVADPRDAEWAGVPHALRRVLSKALAADPRGRWRDAAAFRHALWTTRVRPYRRRTAVLTAAGVTVGAVAFALLPSDESASGRPLPPTGLVVRVAPPAYRGPASAAWLSDSVPHVYARLMQSATDFRVCAPASSCADPTITLRSTVTVADSLFSVRVEYEGSGRIGSVYAGSLRAIDEWAQEVNRAADAGLRVIWNTNSPLRDWLPLDALPESDAGYEAWFRAERLLNQAQWQLALRAFKSAFTLDTTCLLCSWRITEIQRWLVEPPETGHLRLAHNAIDRFPPHYRPVTTARWLPLPERLAVLEDATRRWPGFPYAWFLWGEEVFHRGPLVGLSPAVAISAFQRTTQLDPTFGPAWEHLAWANTAAGDAPAARAALDAYDSLLSRAVLNDDFAHILRALMELGYAWRFSQHGLRVATAVLADPRIARFPDVGAGPRLLGTFDARQGMLELAEILLDSPAMNSDTRYSAHIAKLLALLALGRVEEARRLAAELGFQYPERRDVPLFALKLDAALVLLDPTAIAVDPAALTARLAAYGSPGASSLHGLAGASWLRLLLDRASAPIPPVRIDSLPPPLATVLHALAADDPRQALDATAPARIPLIAEVLREQPRLHVEHLPDAFYRTVLRFQRAAWHAALGERIAAADELRFHEAWDLGGRPLGLPEPGEVDWAFGTLARWRRAELLRQTPQLSEACTDLQVVAARWAQGDPVYRARADSATAILGKLGCPAPPASLRW